jgi:hypothetical protein
MAPPPAYKRSWKNLLLNKRYQLRFTLFMVGISSVLMTGLGIRVMKFANEATTVAMARVRGEPCPKVPELSDDAASSDEDAVPMKLDDGPDSPATATPAAGSAETTPTVTNSPSPSSNPPDQQPPGADRHIEVQIDESSMTLKPTVPKDFADRIIAHWTCDMRQAGAIDALERGRLRILWVLLATGIALCLGLAVYGIKMTHKVAGPMFKVSLYFAKMRDGRLDKVYNLRKGDQLVDFYEHFKAAHAGVVKLERADIERIQEVVAAAEAAGAGQHEAVAELKKVLARKEKSLE